MGKRRPKWLDAVPSIFAQARDELFSHIVRCGVLDAIPEHRREWFDDTMVYLTERYERLTEAELRDLRVLGERYCEPVKGNEAAVGADGPESHNATVDR